MAKIDILLPFWGDVELFKKTVNSVLRQTEKDWKLIILDDHYPSDEPKSFIESLDDKRINYIRHSKNLGITKNFNAALEQATAKHFVMIGCDDVMLDNYVERALGQIGSASLYQPMVEVIDESGKVYTTLTDRVKNILRPKKAGVYDGEKLATSLCTGVWLYFPSITWKTKAVQEYGFDDTYKIAEDFVLEMNLIIDGHALKVDNETTFQYRRFSESLSSVEKKRGGVRFQEERAVYKHFAKIFKEKGWKRAERAANLRITSRIHELINR